MSLMKELDSTADCCLGPMYQKAEPLWKHQKEQQKGWNLHACSNLQKCHQGVVAEFHDPDAAGLSELKSPLVTRQRLLCCPVRNYSVHLVPENGIIKFQFNV